MAALIHDDSILVEELEVLESIYIHELFVEKDESGHLTTVKLQLHPATGHEVDKQYVCMTLNITPGSSYPDEAPHIVIRNPRGIAEEEIQSVTERMCQLAIERQGGPMLYELIEVAKECLTEGNMPHCPCMICLEHFTEGEAFTKTDCYHYFHQHCLARYIQFVTIREEDEGLPPHIEVKEVQVVCPVCRVCITYDSDSLELVPEPSSGENEYQPSKDIRKWQADVKVLFEKQKANGGIIDLEEEKNKYLLPANLVITLESAVDENTEDVCFDEHKAARDGHDKSANRAQSRSDKGSNSRTSSRASIHERDRQWQRHPRHYRIANSHRNTGYLGNDNDHQHSDHHGNESKRYYGNEHSHRHPGYYGNDHGRLHPDRHRSERSSYQGNDGRNRRTGYHRNDHRNRDYHGDCHQHDDLENEYEGYGGENKKNGQRGDSDKRLTNRTYRESTKSGYNRDEDRAATKNNPSKLDTEKKTFLEAHVVDNKTDSGTNFNDIGTEKQKFETKQTSPREDSSHGKTPNSQPQHVQFSGDVKSSSRALQDDETVKYRDEPGDVISENSSGQSHGHSLRENRRRDDGPRVSRRGRGGWTRGSGVKPSDRARPQYSHRAHRSNYSEEIRTLDDKYRDDEHVHAEHANGPCQGNRAYRLETERPRQSHRRGEGIARDNAGQQRADDQPESREKQKNRDEIRTVAQNPGEMRATELLSKAGDTRPTTPALAKGRPPGFKVQGPPPGFGKPQDKAKPPLGFDKPRDKAKPPPGFDRPRDRAKPPPGFEDIR